MKQLKGFTLFEIIISIILVSILYAFAINSFQGKSEKKIKVTLDTLKQELLAIDYENEVKLYCIENDLSCFLFVDGELQKQKIEGLFSFEPLVYEYNKELDIVDFNPLELEKLQSYNVVFEYACSTNRKCTESIVFENEKGYIFNDIYMQPKIVKSISEIENYFEDTIQEVKDAF